MSNTGSQGLMFAADVLQKQQLVNKQVSERLINMNSIDLPEGVDNTFSFNMSQVQQVESI
jgi:hypothetical protein